MKQMDFLKKAKDSSPFLSEQRILEYLSKFDKAIAISMDSLDNIQKYLLDIKSEIEKASRSDIHHLELNDNGIVSTKIIGHSSINELEFHNLMDETFKDYAGYCFIVNAGISYVMCNGTIDSDIGGSLIKFRTLQEMNNARKTVHDLREVFENFYSACKYRKNYYEECFNSDGMIKANVKEQDLRNILMRYLDKNVKGDIHQEFCTDYYNDEESVDIYLNDGIEIAIIEVKFSFSKKYYLGSTYYNFKVRVGDGMNQLDKYAQHLAKDKRPVHYGYVYVFCCNDLTETDIINKTKEKYEEIKDILSPEFFSIYKATITNDMKQWGISV